MKITINGRRRDWAGKKISYSCLIKMAGFRLGSIVSVSWSYRDHKPGMYQHGILSPRRSVPTKDGMNFTAIITGNA
jgi:hypothetical protein